MDLPLWVIIAAVVVVALYFITMRGFFSKSREIDHKTDYSKIPPELAKTFTYLDEHADEMVENLRKWIQQPSISNSGCNDPTPTPRITRPPEMRSRVP